MNSQLNTNLNLSPIRNPLNKFGMGLTRDNSLAQFDSANQIALNRINSNTRLSNISPSKKSVDVTVRDMAFAGKKQKDDIGVEGYSVPLWKNCKTPVLGMAKGPKITMFDDIMKNKKKLPAPGQYNYESSIKDSIHYNNKWNKSPRKTEFEQLAVKHKKRPGVGQYNISPK